MHHHQPSGTAAGKQPQLPRDGRHPAQISSQHRLTAGPSRDNQNSIESEIHHVTLFNINALSTSKTYILIVLIIRGRLGSLCHSSGILARQLDFTMNTPPDPIAAAVILAAGMGSRLHSLTADRPKTLVAVGPEGETILDLLLDRIADCGIASTYIVTGYRHDMIAHHLQGRADSDGIHLVFNPDFAGMNNGRSLLAVREALEGKSFLKMDGDLVLDPGLMPLLTGGDGGTAALVDDVRPLVEEDMKVLVDPETGLISAFGKHLPANSHGVSIGLERIAAADGPLVFDAIDRMIYTLGKGDGYYEDAYQLVLGEGLAVKAISTRGLGWQEIDNLADLDAARAMLRQC
jgi:choline kinase